MACPVSSSGSSVTFGIQLIGSQNAREHPMARARRVKTERRAAKLQCLAYMVKPKVWPVTVKLTRVGPRKLDSDNLAGACKAVRDGVADWLGVDDGDESRVRWEYAQERGEYAVRIELQPHEVTR